MSKKTVLILAAHPDDEVLGCGGTIARLVQEGNSVYCAILGEGITSRFSSREDAEQVAVDTLHNQAKMASKLLGVEDLITFKLPDNRFDTVPLLEIVKMIEDLIARFEPSIIFTHHGGDLNVDHATIFRATLTATRPVSGHCVTTIYSYEVPSSTEWSFQTLLPSFQPNVFFDISGTLELKLQAIGLYEAEVRPFPHPRSVKALEANALRWGSVVGLEAAEAFQVIREIRSLA